MEVILIDNVYELGRRGDVIKVSEGYGRNYLIPRKLAIPATPGNLKRVEEQRIALAKKEAKFVEEAELLARELSQLHILISRKAGETGSLFGSVNSKDLAEAFEAGGIKLNRRKIMLQQPLKRIGNYTVEIRPHSDVQVNVLVSVLPEADELICKTMPRGEESDAIVRELDAKIADISGSSAPENNAE